MYQHSLSSEQVRAIITGQMLFRRCPDCDGKGQVWWMHYTLKERPHDDLQKIVSAQYAADFCSDDFPDIDFADFEECDCEICQGIGYLSNELPGGWPCLYS